MVQPTARHGLTQQAARVQHALDAQIVGHQLLRSRHGGIDIDGGLEQPSIPKPPNLLSLSHFEPQSSDIVPLPASGAQ